MERYLDARAFSAWPADTESPSARLYIPLVHSHCFGGSDRVNPGNSITLCLRSSLFCFHPCPFLLRFDLLPSSAALSVLDGDVGVGPGCALTKGGRTARGFRHLGGRKTDLLPYCRAENKLREQTSRGSFPDQSGALGV